MVTTNYILNNSLGNTPEYIIYQTINYDKLIGKQKTYERYLSVISQTRFDDIENELFNSSNDYTNNNIYNIKLSNIRFTHFELDYPCVNYNLYSGYALAIIELLNISTNKGFSKYDLDEAVLCNSKFNTRALRIEDNDIELVDGTYNSNLYLGGMALVMIFQFLKRSLDNNLFYKIIESESYNTIDLIKIIQKMDYDCFQSNPFIISAIPVIEPIMKNQFEMSRTLSYSYLADANRGMKKTIKSGYDSMYKPIASISFNSYKLSILRMQAELNILLSYNELKAFFSSKLALAPILKVRPDNLWV